MAEREDNMNSIVFEHVDKTYDKKVFVIKDLNLAIKKGERIIFLGPSGCGKSTTLRMIAGLETISAGNLFMGDKLVNNIPSGEREVAMVFQNYALFPHMSVEDNISYGLKIQKMPKDEIANRLKEALRILELEGLEKRKPRELSGGQRQRVALARAVVKRSDYFLLDEPLSNLDAQLRAHARKQLVKIHETFHQTLVYVTHDQVEAMTVGNRIALMNKGDIQMIDTPKKVYNRPVNVFTAKFIGSPPMNIINIEYADGQIIIGEHRITPPEMWKRLMYKNGKDRFIMGIRPEHVKLIINKEDDAVPCSIRYIEDYGNDIGMYFSMAGEEMIAVCDSNAPINNQEVYFHPDYKNIHLFDADTENSIGYPQEID